VRTREDLAPAAAYVIAVAGLCVMDAVIKELSATITSVELVFVRYAVAAALMLPFLAFNGGWRIDGQALGKTALRAVVMLVTAVMFYISLARLPLADAVVVSFTSPFFMVLFGRLLLKEPVPARALTGVVIGFIGVVIVVAGTLSGRGDLVGYLCSAASAVTYAAFYTMTRRDSAKTPILMLVTFQSLIAALLAAPVMFAVGPVVAPPLLPALAMGALGALGHLLIGWAFANAPSTRIAPIEFTALLWAALLGAFYFGDSLTLGTVVGGGLIIAGCLVVMRPDKPRPASRRQP
jgi:S-adenosylmethionine uptake transporter